MIVIGLGSNQGDRLANLRQAVSLLKNHPRITLCAVSPVYQSDAQLPENAPDDWAQPFFNAAVACKTDLMPSLLYAELKQIETAIGRERRDTWAPRVIDLDILMWGDLQYNQNGLTIPHCRLLERPFALWPLLDLFSDWDYPQELLAKWGTRFNGVAPFRTRQVSYRLEGTCFMGILNVTPDSFSDGGLFDDCDAAVAQAVTLFESGAEVIDVGAESTRPRRDEIVSAEEEWRRLEPVLKVLVNHWQGYLFRPAISVDTRRADVAKKAIELGADWINDVTGFEDAAMLDVVAAADVKIVSMQSVTIPPLPDRIIPRDQDPIEFMLGWGRRQLERFDAAGIDRQRIILDPGVGFGKTPEQNLSLIRRACELKQLGVPILIGHSRKSFHQVVSNASAAERDLETAIASISLFDQGVDYLRVHDVACSLRAVAMQKRLDSIQSRQEYNYELPSGTQQIAGPETPATASLL